MKEFKTEIVKATLEFHGGFVPAEIDNIREVHGIYAAFACIDRGDRYKCVRVVYIGKADAGDSVRSRIDDHIHDRDESDSGKQSCWEKEYCKNGEIIVYAYAEYEENLVDIESALIYDNQPTANIESKEQYIGDAQMVFVHCRGRRANLKPLTIIPNLITPADLIEYFR